MLLLTVAACGFSARSGNTDRIDAAVPDDGADASTDPDAPDAAPGPCKAAAIESMAAQNCVLRTDGEVRCWGLDDMSQLGIAGTSTCPGGKACVKVPTKVTFPEAIAKLGLGDKHGCALSATKTYCWGLNAHGQLGNNSTTSLATPTEITQRAGAKAIRGGDEHTCSMTNTSVSCSGYNMHAEIGDNSTTERDTPQAVVLAAIPKSIGLGFHHSCAISAAVVECWGRNDQGQVGGAGDPVMIPRTVANVVNPTIVAAGLLHTCARLSDGSMKCWGGNADGQLGVGNTMPQTGPQLLGLTGVTQVVAGANHTCALAGTGVWCWGEGYTNAPTQINFNGMAATQVSAGSYHDCAILMDGTVRCWGVNGYGQLGNNATQNAATPVQAVVCP
jgi:alpha-tubulin suppressor-like RCC1 family protein